MPPIAFVWDIFVEKEFIRAKYYSKVSLGHENLLICSYEIGDDVKMIIGENCRHVVVEIISPAQTSTTTMISGHLLTN